MMWKEITLSKKQLTILLNVGAMSLHGQSQIVQRSFTLNHNNNIWVFLWLELLCSLHNTKDIQIFSYSDLTLQYSKQILNLYGLRGCMKYCWGKTNKQTNKNHWTKDHLPWNHSGPSRQLSQCAALMTGKLILGSEMFQLCKWKKWLWCCFLSQSWQINPNHNILKGLEILPWP